MSGHSWGPAFSFDCRSTNRLQTWKMTGWLETYWLLTHAAGQQMHWKPPQLRRNLCSPPAPKLTNRSQWSLGPTARLSPGLQMCGLRMRPVASSTERGPSNATSAAPTGRRAREVFQTGLGWPAQLGRGSPHLPGRWGAGTIRPFVGACDHCACCLFCLPEVSVWSSPALDATSALGF